MSSPFRRSAGTTWQPCCGGHGTGNPKTLPVRDLVLTSTWLPPPVGNPGGLWETASADASVKTRKSPRPFSRRGPCPGQSRPTPTTRWDNEGRKPRGSDYPFGSGRNEDCTSRSESDFGICKMCVYAGIERCNCCRACILHTVLSRSDALPDALCVVTVPIPLFLFLSHWRVRPQAGGRGGSSL